MENIMKETTMSKKKNLSNLVRNDIKKKIADVI